MPESAQLGEPFSQFHQIRTCCQKALVVNPATGAINHYCACVEKKFLDLDVQECGPDLVFCLKVE